MLKWLLHYPDDPTWHEQPYYSNQVAAALTQAYRCLRLGSRRVDRYREATAVVYPLSRSQMSLRQRLHVVYVLAMGHVACEEYVLASGCLDEALELAILLDDPETRIEILYLRGFVNQGRSLFREATSDFAESVMVLEHVTHGQPDPRDKSILLDTLIQLASLEFFHTAYERSLAHLDRARSLVGETSGNERTVADILWISALHDRQRGKLESALTHAKQACSAYDAFAAPAAFGRIQVVAAEIALDICQRLPVGSEFDQHYKIANTYIDGGIAAVEDHVGSMTDESGQGLALLALTRAARIARQNGGEAVDRQGIIEDVITVARKLNDSALLCQAYVRLGDELSTSQNPEGGSVVYREAIHIAEIGGVGSLAAPAQRALWNREELIGIDD